MKTITLSDAAYKCLLETLSEAAEDAADCSCNDPDTDLLKSFTFEELEQMLISSYGKKEYAKLKKEWQKEKDEDMWYGTWEDAIKHGHNFFNNTHIDYLYSLIKKQGKQGRIKK